MRVRVGITLAALAVPASSQPARSRGVAGIRPGGWEVMGRKIAIVGAGAVGGYAGAHMVQAGET
jgi:hypothetical protein